MFSLYDAALFLGIFRGWGPRRVYDPHSGTGTGDSLSPRAFTGTVLSVNLWAEIKMGLKQKMRKACKSAPA